MQPCEESDSKCSEAYRYHEDVDILYRCFKSPHAVS